MHNIKKKKKNKERDRIQHDGGARSADWGPVPAGFRYLSGQH